MRGDRSQDEILKQILSDCLTDETDYVPSDYEIRQEHHFSKKFNQQMEVILKQEKEKEEKRKRKEFFRQHIFSRRNVAVVVVAAVLALVIGVTRPWELELFSLGDGDQIKSEEALGGGNDLTRSMEENSLETKEDLAGGKEAANDIVEDTKVTEQSTKENSATAESEALVEWNYVSGSMKDGFIELRLSNHSMDQMNYSPVTEVDVAGKDGKFAPVYLGKSDTEDRYLKGEEEKKEKLELKDYGIVAPGKYRFTRNCQGEELTVSFVLESVKK